MVASREEVAEGDCKLLWKFGVLVPVLVPVIVPAGNVDKEMCDVL